MLYALQEFFHRLKGAREAHNLSQRTLADKIGIPQSHLSKIEAGVVNIKLGSFVEMARMLGLEVMLIPRQEVSLVKDLIESKENARLSPEVKPAYRLDDEDEND